MHRYAKSSVAFLKTNRVGGHVGGKGLAMPHRGCPDRPQHSSCDSPCVYFWGIHPKGHAEYFGVHYSIVSPVVSERRKRSRSDMALQDLTPNLTPIRNSSILNVFSPAPSIPVFDFDGPPHLRAFHGLFWTTRVRWGYRAY